MSVGSELARFLIRVSNVRRVFASESEMHAYVARNRPAKERRPPSEIFTRFRTERRDINGRPVYHIQPSDNTPERHIVFLHGGAYVGVMKILEWKFLIRLMEAQPCQVTVPLYGLAPEYTYRDTFELMTKLYRGLLTENSAENIFLLGESCGGGIALGFAQSLMELDLPQPGGLVLLSPALDITLRNPDIPEIEARDPVMAVPGNREAGRMWAGGDDPTIPQLSPINGPLKGLAPICALVGSNEILMPDVRRLRDRANEEAQTFQYLEYRSMFHVWMLLPTPEGQQATNDVIEFIDHPRKTKSASTRAAAAAH